MGVSQPKRNINPAILNTHDLGCGIGLLYTSCFSNAALRYVQEKPQSPSSVLGRRARKMETFTCERRVPFGWLLHIGISIHEGTAGDPRFGTY
jgi:hypothetical protein